MQTGELGLAEDLVAELAAALHDRAEHLIVRATREEDLAGVELEEGAADRPGVDGEIVRHAEY